MTFRNIRGEKPLFSFLPSYPRLLLARKVWSLPGYLARIQPGPFENRGPLWGLEGCFSLESIRSSKSHRNARWRTDHQCLLFLKSRKEGSRLEVSIYIYIYNGSIDRQNGEIRIRESEKKKSRYRPAVTVMRLSTDSLLRHHINIRSNLFERIFPRAARPEILSRSTATFYTRWLIPASASDILPNRDSQSFKLYTFLPTNLPLIPIQSNPNSSVRIENRDKYEFHIESNILCFESTNRVESIELY